MPLPPKQGIPSKAIKVKLFSFPGAQALEQELNSWLGANNVDIHDFIYQHTHYPPHDTYSCMVIYRP